MSTEQATNFHIKSDIDLMNVLREVRELQAEINRINELYTAEMERVNAWKDAETQKVTNELKWRTSQIEAYHAAVLAEDPKAKSISTPHGTVKSVTRKPVPKKPDADVLLAVLEDLKHDEYIKVEMVKKPDWAAFKKELQVVNGKVVTTDGEVLDDIEIDEGGTTFKIEVSDV